MCSAISQFVATFNNYANYLFVIKKKGSNLERHIFVNPLEFKIVFFCSYYDKNFMFRLKYAKI